jgi:pimeloyl-ACP methyl ester carboxylesterase
MMNATTSIRTDATADGRFGRRVVLAGAAAAAAGIAAHLSAPLLSAAQEATPAAAEGGRATFVLVPGAWAGAWEWSRVVPLLRAAGHDVYATTPTGLGDRAHLATPAIDLDTHITDVVNVLEYEDLHDVTLVGWSYSGMIITGVAEQVPERLAQLVYFDADVPTDGQNGWDAELYSEEARLGDVMSGTAAGRPGFITVDPYVEWLRSLTKDPADAEWMLAKMVPQSLATYIQPVELGNPVAAALPRAFIFCTEGKGEADVDHTVRTAERVQSDPGWSYREVADTHLAPINAPRATTEALVSLI